MWSFDERVYTLGSVRQKPALGLAGTSDMKLAVDDSTILICPFMESRPLAGSKCEERTDDDEGQHREHQSSPPKSQRHCSAPANGMSTYTIELQYDVRLSGGGMRCW